MADASGAMDAATDYRYEFGEWRELSAFLDGHVADLKREAAPRATTGAAATDQDHPTGLIALRPARPSLPPLLILGGMGPLAGVQALWGAARRWGNRREVVLLQLCRIPDRTAAIEEEQLLGCPGPCSKEVARALAAGILEGLRTLTAATNPEVPVQILVACNAAHAFMPRAQALLADAGDKTRGLTWRVASLVEAVMRHVAAHPPRRLLVASTRGTRIAGIYTAPLRAAAVPFVEPDSDAQELLMRAIYRGVKALDPETTAREGVAFFSTLTRPRYDVDAVLAGCTEIPEVIAEVNRRHEHTAALLAGLRVLDPIALALDALA